MADLQDPFQEIQELKTRIRALETLLNQVSEALALDIAYDRQRISRLERTSTPSNESKPGNKTVARIASLKSILKEHGGAYSFKGLQDELNLSPSEFTRLVKSLDMRSFVISNRPGSKKGEKILSLKHRLYDPIPGKPFLHFTSDVNTSRR